jgi:hypothetical protein
VASDANLPDAGRVRATVPLVMLAETDSVFDDFAPYVPAINDAGVVVAQAALRQGGSTVLEHAAAGLAHAPLVFRGRPAHVYSHPAVDAEGGIAVYCSLDAEHQAVAVRREGHVLLLADTAGELLGIGPLGPTMNMHGTVAFRADLRRGGAGLFLGRPGRVTRVADTERFAAFHGLPLVTTDEAVVFRADQKDGTQGIYMRSARALEIVVQTGDAFESLGAFPSANDRGVVAFVATTRSGDDGVFVSEAGTLRRVQSQSDGFESFRGALVNNRGTVFFFGTPRGEGLGVFVASPHREGRSVRLLGIGDVLDGANIVEFALNPVSINNLDQLAVRLRLSDGRQRIVRVDAVEHRA